MVAESKQKDIWIWLEGANHIATLIDWRQHRLIFLYLSWVLSATQPPLHWSLSFFPSHYHSCSPQASAGKQSLPLRPLQSGASTFCVQSQLSPVYLLLGLTPLRFPPIYLSPTHSNI